MHGNRHFNILEFRSNVERLKLKATLSCFDPKNDWDGSFREKNHID